MVFRAIESVLTLVILMGLGYWLCGRSWFGDAGTDIFSKYAANVGIPCYMFDNILRSCGTPESLAALAGALPVPIGIILASFLLALALSRLFGFQPGKRGVFINAVTFSNVVLIGFPVITSLFGEAAIPNGMAYYTANTLLFWTLGVFLLRLDGGSKARFFSRENMKNIFGPPVMGLILGILFILSGLRLPYFLDSALEKVSQTSTPVAMMFIGCIIHSAGLKRIRINKSIAVIMLVRFLLSPLIVGTVCTLLPIEPMAKKVIFVLATMPAMTQLGIMAKESGSDCEFASVAVALTSIVSMVTIPLYMAVIQAFHLFS